MDSGARRSSGVLSGLPATTSTVVQMTAALGALFTRRVGYEPPLALERSREPVEHLVEGLGKLAELIVGTAQRNPRGQVVLRRGAGGRGDLPHRTEPPPPPPPPPETTEPRTQLARCLGERDQRVLETGGFRPQLDPALGYASEGGDARDQLRAIRPPVDVGETRQLTLDLNPGDNCFVVRGGAPCPTIV